MVDEVGNRKIVLIYNSPTASSMIPYLDASLVPGLIAVASLRYEEGVQLLSLYNARPRGLYVSFPSAPLVEGVVDTIRGGVVSDFSEYGPTFELVGQPSLTAPGGNVLSTFPTAMGGVGVISGTSMACPFICASPFLSSFRLPLL
jgi:subtilisin family serine protease